jgi:hypothetical protein
LLLQDSFISSISSKSLFGSLAPAIFVFVLHILRVPWDIYIIYILYTLRNSYNSQDTLHWFLLEDLQ